MAKRLAALTSSAIGVLLVLGCLRALSQSQRNLALETPVPVSAEAAQRFDDKIKRLTGGSFVIDVSEEEVTSYLALRLADTIPLASPQIRFAQGQVLVAGYLTTPVRLRVTFASAVRAEQGQPKVEFQEGTLAGIRIPPFLLSSLSDTVEELVSEIQGYPEIRHLEVTAGRLRIEGSIRTP